MASTLTIYIDESQTPDPAAMEPGRPFRVGCLVVDPPVDPGTVARAIERLRADKDAVGNRQDDETLERGWFHASFDSKNAHSHLCTALVADIPGAEFYETSWSFEGSTSDRSGRDLHHLINQLGIVPSLDSDVDSISLTMAERDGTFSGADAEPWAEGFRALWLESAVSLPDFVTRFPRITVEVVGGDNAGVQACDFALWAIQRFYAEGDDTWVGRLGMKQVMAFEEAHGELGGTEWILGSSPTAPGRALLHPEEPVSMDDVDASGLPDLFREIEGEVLRAYELTQVAESHVEHLAEEMSSCVETIRKAKIKAEEAGAIARCFFTAVDTVPLYSETSASRRRAQIKKLLCAKVLTKTNVAWLGVARAWCTTHNS